MREIKFRVFNTDTKKMSKPFDLMQFSWDQDGEYGFGEFSISNGRPGKREIFYPLMQFTGLKDKNGNEIYEGDILSPNCRVVSFESDVRLKSQYEVYGGVGFYTRCHNIDKPEQIGVWSFGITQAECSEIIGNIHENKDLLK